MIYVCNIFLASLPDVDVAILKAPSKNPPPSLRPCAGDAYLLFQVYFILEAPRYAKTKSQQTRNTSNREPPIVLLTFVPMMSM